MNSVAKVVLAADKLGMIVERVVAVPSSECNCEAPECDIWVYFFDGDRIGWVVDCGNGELVGGLDDRGPEKFLETWDIKNTQEEIDIAVKKIHDFLHARLAQKSAERQD